MMIETGPSFKERSHILVGERRGTIWLVRRQREAIGERARVEMDWNWALRREESRGDVMGFEHTHPPGGGVTPSDRDIRTMRAWCVAFGKPLLCVIACDGDVRTTLFRHDGDTGQMLPVTHVFKRGVIVVLGGDENDEQSA